MKAARVPAVARQRTAPSQGVDHFRVEGAIVDVIRHARLDRDRLPQHHQRRDQRNAQPAQLETVAAPSLASGGQLASAERRARHTQRQNHQAHNRLGHLHPQRPRCEHGQQTNTRRWRQAKRTWPARDADQAQSREPGADHQSGGDDAQQHWRGVLDPMVQEIAGAKPSHADRSVGERFCPKWSVRH